MHVAQACDERPWAGLGRGAETTAHCEFVRCEDIVVDVLLTEAPDHRRRRKRWSDDTADAENRFFNIWAQAPWLKGNFDNTMGFPGEGPPACKIP